MSSALQVITAFYPPNEFNVERDFMLMHSSVKFDSYCNNCLHKFTTHSLQLKLLNFNCKACEARLRVRIMWNHMMKATNGNIIRVVHMNKGKACLSRSTAVLEDFVDTLFLIYSV